jgi:hypothetical protein
VLSSSGIKKMMNGIKKRNEKQTSPARRLAAPYQRGRGKKEI